MIVVQGSDDVPAAARGGVLAIGNFDGVHRGHRALIAAAIDEGKRLGAPAGAIVSSRIHASSSSPTSRISA